MLPLGLRLLLGALLLHANDVSAVKDLLAEHPLFRLPNTPIALTSPLFIDETPEEISLLNLRPSLINPQYPNRLDRQFDWTQLDQMYRNLVPSTAFKSVSNQLKKDLETINQRQDVLSKYVECVNSEVKTCKKPPELDDDSLKHLYFNWMFGKPDSDLITPEKFFSMMAGVRNAIEKLTLRQNVLYEYVNCANSMSSSSSECTASIKPVLDVMFSNNPNTSGEIIQNLFYQSKAQPNNSFFQYFNNLFNVPNFSQWFGGYNFNPLSSLFGGNFFGGANPWAFPFPFFTPTVNKPPGDFWFPGSFIPGFGGGAAVSTSTGPGGTVTVTQESVNPGGSTYSSGTASGGTVSVSSSGDGNPQFSGVTVSSSSTDNATPGQPSNEQYTVNHPDGGTSHISTSTDGAGGSSISVVSTSGPSGRSARQLVYGPALSP